MRTNILSKVYDGVLRTYIYTSGLCPIAAAGNAIANADTFYESFGRAFFNQFKLAVPVNVLYPVVFNFLKRTNHYRLYANLYQCTVTASFLAWHHFVGTESPIETVLPMAIAAFALVNKHVSDTLEEKVA